MAPIRKMLASIDEKVEYTPMIEERETSSISDVSDVDLAMPLLLQQRQPRCRRLITIMLKTLTFTLAILGLLSLLYSTVTHIIFLSRGRFVPSSSPSCSCGGTNIAEAKRRGCRISPMAISWLPPHCIDSELEQQFDRAGPGKHGAWDYWADENKTRLLTRDEIGLLAEKTDGVFYASHEWHVMHCIYTWQKHYRSRWTGVTVERRSNGLDHIAHCASIFRYRDPLQSLGTKAGIALNADNAGDDGHPGSEDSRGDKFELLY